MVVTTVYRRSPRMSFIASSVMFVSWSTALKVAGEEVLVAGSAASTHPSLHRLVGWPPMCLLIVISGVVPGMPLIVAANRDERRARPAIPMTRLDGVGGPAIRGGRDEVGGGTWLATNEVGVIAGLTNRPLRDGPDAAKRSRGELPLALAGHPTAAAAVAAFGPTIDPRAYNPSWLLVADRHDAFFVDVT